MRQLLIITPLLVVLMWLSPQAVFAQVDCETVKWGCLEVGLPGGEYSRGQPIESVASRGIVNYVVVLVPIATAIIVIVGLMTVIVGGYIYMTAGGSGDRVQTAKTMIGLALLGIAIALISVLLLNVIHPQFAKDPSEPTIEKQ